MKRFAGLMVLMALTTPAYAGSYSFVIAGRHIHVEASRHCRSLSCVSWSEITRKRDRDDTVAPKLDPAPAQRASAVPALKPVETRTVIATPPAPPLAKTDPPPAPPATQTPAAQAPAAQPKPNVKVEPKVEPKVDAKVDAKIDPNAEAKPRVGFDVKPQPKLEPKVEQKVETKVEQKAESKAASKSDTTASVTRTPEKQADKPAVIAKPAPSKTSLQSEGEAIEAPIGDWQTEGRKGLVRIEPCGTALCGYLINTSSNAKGETVLINMKPKANSEWSGSIYSRASGNTYYATMSMKRPNTLRVEACVVGHYFCSGNNWTRISSRPGDMVSPRETREASADPAR